MTLTLTPPAQASPALDGSLELRDVTVAYDRRVVLRGVSAHIERGQVIGVIGPNGGGKSTLLKAILGIVPIVGGSVTLFGQPARRARKRMACVPQREVVDWDFPVSVREVVLMGRYPHMGLLRRATPADNAAVESALGRVDMIEHAGTQIGRLSGGQQQRVFIARALAQEADVLILDEPMTGIDVSTQELVLQVIEEERQRGKIILMATHDLPDDFAGAVIVLGPADTPRTERWQHAGMSAHHRHQHENLGREHL
jgi:manganese/zinc/iron transport system ATP- binding protein